MDLSFPIPSLAKYHLDTLLPFTANSKSVFELHLLVNASINLFNKRSDTVWRIGFKRPVAAKCEVRVAVQPPTF